MARRWPYEAAFKLEVPNLGLPDAEGWAVGDCPYCRTPGGLKANLRSGRWLCLPPAPPTPPPGLSSRPHRPLRPVPGGRHVG
jgi:hypothetical protein